MAEPMTGAELKVALQGLALPPAWFAEHMGVIMRTVVRWFDSEQVPNRVAAAANALVEQADNLVAAWSEDSFHSGGMLLTYRTDRQLPEQMTPPDAPRVASWHRMLTHRVAANIGSRGILVRIEYASDDSAKQPA